MWVTPSNAHHTHTCCHTYLEPLTITRTVAVDGAALLLDLSCSLELLLHKETFPNPSLGSVPGPEP
jgi:hypothetical protein